MLIWTGWGIVIGLVGGIGIALTQLAIDAIMHDRHFYSTHSWCEFVGACVAAAVAWPVGRFMNRGQEQTVINPQTGQPVIDPETGKPAVIHGGGDGHSFFFIPVQYWWIVYLGIGTILLLSK